MGKGEEKENYNPNPFAGDPRPNESLEGRTTTTRDGITALMKKYLAGEISWRALSKGKDNGFDKTLNRGKKDSLKHWLYRHHHDTSERWKCLGQLYWSVEAYASFKEKFFNTPDSKRFARDGLPHQRTLPKSSTEGARGLVSEHVMPKQACVQYLQHAVEYIEKQNSNTPIEVAIDNVLTWNLCAVVTKAEDDEINNLGWKSSHPDMAQFLTGTLTPEEVKPWKRYEGTSIKFICNPNWTDKEIAALKNFELKAD